MAAVAHRRLQKEIELAIKKVSDGVREFSIVWQKVEDAQVTMILRAMSTTARSCNIARHDACQVSHAPVTIQLASCFLKGRKCRAF